jgi:group I intron endonuclease
MIIYLITNTVNGKKYVGQHCGDSTKRWKEHLSSALKLENPLPLYRAMRKYGTEQFSYGVLEQIPLSKGPEYLNDREKELIKEYKSHISQNGYNVTWGGQGIITYYCSAEKTKKLSDSLDKTDYGQYDPFTGELIKVWTKMKDISLHFNISSSQVSNASKWHYGEGKGNKTAGGFMWLSLKNNEEFPSYITPLGSENTKGYASVRKRKEVTDNSEYEIAQYTLSGVLSNVWPNNISQISIKTGISSQSISSAIKGTTRVTGGYQWRKFLKDKSPDNIESEIVKSDVKLSKRQLTSTPIVKYLENKEVFTYGSIIDAILENNIKPMDILFSIENGKEDPNGFIWKWKYQS